MKVLSDSPGLVELAFSYRSLPDGLAPPLVKFLCSDDDKIIELLYQKLYSRSLLREKDNVMRPNNRGMTTSCAAF